jgi:hypothetical protein
VSDYYEYRAESDLTVHDIEHSGSRQSGMAYALVEPNEASW